MRREIAGLVVLFILTVVGACGEREQPRIAFHSDRDEGLNIYVMNADGSGIVRLTDDSNLGAYPSWSPDGRRIAFVAPGEDPYPSADRHEDRIVWNIYVMNADGSVPMRLTDASAKDTEPSWSPEGKHVAFASERSGNWEIYVVKVDETSLARLTGESESDEHSYRLPVGLVGTGLTRLTNGPGGWSPSWSPIGGRIAFVSARDGNWEIYVMNSDGTSQTRLTDNPAKELHARWSPDGRTIAFTSDRDGNYEIYVMNSDGTGKIRLTDNPHEDTHPSWSPDGKRIAFASSRDGNFEIYVMNADGTGQTRLTDNEVLDFYPSWSP